MCRAPELFWHCEAHNSILIPSFDFLWLFRSLLMHNILIYFIQVTDWLGKLMVRVWWERIKWKTKTINQQRLWRGYHRSCGQLFKLHFQAIWKDMSIKNVCLHFIIVPRSFIFHHVFDYYRKLSVPSISLSLTNK